MKAICVTGTPGTGKTLIAQMLAKKLKCKYVDVNKVIEENRLIEGYDKKRKCNIVDEEKLSRALVKLIKTNKKGLVIDSHLSHFIPSKYVELCIVAKCNLKELKQRLESREYHKEKVRENLDSEIFDICHEEAVENFHNVMIVDTTSKSLSSIIKDIISRLKTKQ